MLQAFFYLSKFCPKSFSKNYWLISLVVPENYFYSTAWQLNVSSMRASLFPAITPAPKTVPDMRHLITFHIYTWKLYTEITLNPTWHKIDHFNSFKHSILCTVQWHQVHLHFSSFLLDKWMYSGVAYLSLKVNRNQTVILIHIILSSRRSHTEASPNWWRWCWRWSEN